jgi:2-hydroxychromene-2-carboxylate isomerase
MKHLTFYFDFISPYAYLAFEHLPKALQGLSYQVSYKPILFAGLLKHYGQLGPAEIVPKREWTYRQIIWLAKEQGIEIRLPAAHPFNPLPFLRLAIACGNDGHCNRFVAERIFHSIWRSGAAPEDAQRIGQLSADIQPSRSITDADVKSALIRNTQEAIEAQVFGVPSLCVDKQVFWGMDSLPMLRQYLQGDTWFSQSAWQSAANLPVGTTRR